MARKFCRTLYRIIEKRGKVRCIEEGCDGYISKVGVDYPDPEAMHFVVDISYFRCSKNKAHSWEVMKSNLDDFLVSKS